MVKQADDAELGAAAPWPPDWDEIVLRLLASGPVELADRVETGSLFGCRTRCRSSVAWIACR